MSNKGNWLTRLSTAGLMASLAGCGGEPTGFSDPVSVRRFFASIYAVMPATGVPAAAPKSSLSAAVAASAPEVVHAVVRSGVIPRANNGPTAVFNLESSVITGTPGKIRVTGDGPFTRVAITVPGTIDYWELTLPSPVFELQLIVTGSSSLPNANFTMDGAVGVAGGYGGGSLTAISAVDLAASDIAVIVRWNALADVDLHVTDPKGVEVYFGRTSSPEGGKLDLDSNPACDFDGINQEVITWPVGKAPPGDYKVSVYYWSDCGVPRTDYAVTLMTRGRTVQVLEGAFTGFGSPSTGVETGRLTLP